MIDGIKEFYEKTKLREVIVFGDSAPVAYSYVFHKEYPRLPSIPLPDVNSNSERFMDLIERRESTRTFSEEEVSLEEIAKILKAVRIVDRERDPERRTYPSGGARFPVETYLISFKVDGLVPGAYHYNIVGEELEKLLEEDLKPREDEIVSSPLENTAAAFVLTSALSRMEVKYGHKSYPYSFIEAGHIGQNINLACSQEGLGSCCVGGFIDDTLIEILDLTENEIPLYVVGIGRLPEEKENKRN